MSSEISRQQFEAWFLTLSSIDPYIKGELWDAWQASRKAICVELFGRFEVDRDGGEYPGEDGDLVRVADAVKAIEAQGLKVV